METTGRPGRHSRNKHAVLTDSLRAGRRIRWWDSGAGAQRAHLCAWGEREAAGLWGRVGGLWGLQTVTETRDVSAELEGQETQQIRRAPIVLLSAPPLLAARWWQVEAGTKGRSKGRELLCFFYLPRINKKKKTKKSFTYAWDLLSPSLKHWLSTCRKELLSPGSTGEGNSAV